MYELIFVKYSDHCLKILYVFINRDEQRDKQKVDGRERETDRKKNR